MLNPYESPTASNEAAQRRRSWLLLPALLLMPEYSHVRQPIEYLLWLIWAGAGALPLVTPHAQGSYGLRFA